MRDQKVRFTRGAGAKAWLLQDAELPQLQDHLQWWIRVNTNQPEGFGIVRLASECDANSETYSVRLVEELANDQLLDLCRKVANPIGLDAVLLA
jgi:hypothetical protein